MAWKPIPDTSVLLSANQRIRVRVSVPNVVVVSNLPDLEALVNRMTILTVSGMEVLNASWIPFMPAEIGLDGTLQQTTTGGAIGAAVAGNIAAAGFNPSAFLGMDSYTLNPIGDLINDIKKGPSISTSISLAAIAIIALAVIYLAIQVKEIVP